MVVDATLFSVRSRLDEYGRFLKSLAWNGIAKSCQRLARSRPNYPSFRVGAVALLQANKAGSAEGLLLQAINHFPTRPRLYHLLALAYAQQKKAHESLEAWQTALELDPANEIFAIALRNAAIRFGDFLHAQKIIDRVLKTNPGNPILLDLRNECKIAEVLDQARSLGRRNDWENVAKLTHHIVTGKPNYEAFRLGANAQLRLNEPQKAEKLLLDAITHFPTKPRLYYLLALAHVKNDKPAAALRAWQTALGLEPSTEIFAIALLKSANQFGGITEAKSIVERAFIENPESSVLAQLREGFKTAELLGDPRSGRATDWEDVLENCHRILTTTPNYKTYRLTGIALLKLGRNEEAERLLVEAVEHLPNKYQLFCLLALAYAQQNKLSEWSRTWQAASSLINEDSVEKAANQFGLLPEADELLEAALKKEPQNLTLLQVHAAFAGQTYSIHRDRTGAFDRVKDSWARLARVDPSDPITRTVNKLLEEGSDAALATWNVVKNNLGNEAEVIDVTHRLFKILRELDAYNLIIAISEKDDFISTFVTFGQPSTMELIRLYASSLQRQYRSAEAREVLIRGGFDKSEFEHDRLFLAELDLKEREFAHALRRAQDVLAKSPNSYAAHSIVVRCLATKKHHAEVQCYIADLDSRRAMQDEQLAKLAEASGQAQIAHQYHTRLIEEQPDDTEALRRYVAFLYRTGRWAAIQVLATKYPSLFERDRHAKSLLDDVTRFSNIVGSHGASDETLQKNAIGAIYEEFLRRAPQRISARGEIPKVAIVIASLGPGGAERQCQLLCRQLALAKERKEIADIKLFVSSLSRSPRNAFYLKPVQDAGVAIEEYVSNQPWIYPKDLFENEEATKLISLLQPTNHRQQVLQLHRHLRQFDPNIVHAWLDSTIIAAGLASAYLPKTRLVGRWGSLPPTVQRVSSARDRDRAALLQLAYQALSRSPLVQYTSNSRLTADAYADWIGLSRSEILVVKNGLDFSNLKKSDASRHRIRAELGIAPKSIVIGTAIRLGSEKRPLMWLDIAERVANCRSGTEFIIVGDGALRDELQNRVKHLNCAKVHLVGRQSNIAEWYSAMDVTLMTSSVEGTSNTVLESAYMGLPVVAFNVGGLAEAVVDQKTGFLLPDGDTEAVVERIVKLIDNPDMRGKMSIMANQYMKETFDPTKMAESVLAIYADLMSR